MSRPTNPATCQLLALGAMRGAPSMRAIAALAGVDRDAVSEALRGVRRPTNRTIEKVAAALHVDAGLVAELLRPEAGR